MYLAFFIIGALDLLDALKTSTTESERNGYIEWIYHCQHPHGGFRMWSGTDFGDLASDANAKWDPANIPATYFALALLLMLGDDFKRVRRRQTLQWLRRMQRSDGSFGETLVDGRIEGGRDPRFSYCATGIRFMLRGKHGSDLTIDGEIIEDIELDGLVECIRQAQVGKLYTSQTCRTPLTIGLQAFDGGIADEPFHEPHAGYTFCSLGALKFVDRLKIGRAHV